MDYFEKNLAVLKEQHSNLADIILSDQKEECVVQLTTAENGDPRLIVTKRDGEEVCIHSVENPVKCASDAADLIDKTHKEGLIVLLGLGLGYFAQELLKRFQTGHMMLVY
ncbi:MAG TPA: hypothetical protein VKF36_02620, partial [Syntrophorhabdales bacterium]|nr:hypothetical protein [Syntrophorhabdales bacterium]